MVLLTIMAAMLQFRALFFCVGALLARGAELCDAPGCVVGEDAVDLLQAHVEVADDSATLGVGDVTAADIRSTLEAVGISSADATTRLTTAKWKGLKSSLTTAGITTKDQLSMFLANVFQESDRLKATSEYNVQNKKAEYDWGGCSGTTPCAGDGCSDTCTIHYYGRGYLMTTWYKNYKAASKTVCGTSTCLVNDPSKATTNDGAWKSAAFFWKTSITDVFQKWSSEENKMVPFYTLGESILAINGNLECEVDWPAEGHYGEVGKKKTGDALTKVTMKGHAKKRFCFYRKIYKSLLGSSAPSNDKRCVQTDCASTQDDCDDCH